MPKLAGAHLAAYKRLGRLKTARRRQEAACDYFGCFVACFKREMLTQTHTLPSGANQFEGLEKKPKQVCWYFGGGVFPDKDERDVTERERKLCLVEGQSPMV